MSAILAITGKAFVDEILEGKRDPRFVFLDGQFTDGTAAIFEELLRNDSNNDGD